MKTLSALIVLSLTILVSSSVAEQDWRPMQRITGRQTVFRDYTELLAIKNEGGDRWKGKTHYVLVSATWCPPCGILKSKLERIGKRVYNCDVDKYPAASSKLLAGSNSLPHLIKYRVDKHGNSTAVVFSLKNFMSE